MQDDIGNLVFAKYFAIYNGFIPLWGMLFARCNRVSFCSSAYQIYPFLGYDICWVSQKEILFHCITC